MDDASARGRLGRAARATARGGRSTARVSARAAGGVRRGVRTVTNARGAGESGLSRLLELHFVATAADTLIFTALATTIFFAVPTGEARGQVATSLLVTMAPFVVLAPIIGPLLDRIPHGRRYAIAATMLARAWLAWVMAGAVTGATSGTAFSLYPAALGFLVVQKAYLVTRAAAVPRVLPPAVDLVTTNSRISLAGYVGMALGGGAGVGLTSLAGAEWTLRLAFLIFVVGTWPALALPATVDSSAGEERAQLTATPEHPDQRPEPRPQRRTGTGPSVVLGLRANSVVRAFTGFLTLFLAFRLRTDPLEGVSAGLAVGLVVGAAAVGGGVGTALGNALQRFRPEAVTAGALAVTAVAGIFSSLAYGLVSVLTVAFVAGLAQALAKLCLDAVIQRDVPERVRTSAFARSESVIQLAWVAGGAIGLALPLSGPWGLGIAAVATAAAAVWNISGVRQLPTPRRRPA